jgi:hypothetical protein
MLITGCWLGVLGGGGCAHNHLTLPSALVLVLLLSCLRVVGGLFACLYGLGVLWLVCDVDTTGDVRYDPSWLCGSYLLA